MCKNGWLDLQERQSEIVEEPTLSKDTKIGQWANNTSRHNSRDQKEKKQVELQSFN